MKNLVMVEMIMCSMMMRMRSMSRYYQNLR